MVVDLTHDAVLHIPFLVKLEGKPLKLQNAAGRWSKLALDVDDHVTLLVEPHDLLHLGVDLSLEVLQIVPLPAIECGP